MNEQVKRAGDTQEQALLKMHLIEGIQSLMQVEFMHPITSLPRSRIPMKRSVVQPYIDLVH